LSDALEAVIGAIYLDGGFANAKEFVMRYILTDIEHKQLFYDSKTILQEIVQGEHEQLTYVLLEESGPDHNKSFKVEARVGERMLGQGTGHTKKAAEQEAAYQSLLKIKAEKGSR
jgi:ribonuclease-3